MAQTFIYQILNHYTKREDLDPGFLVLDNSANPKPDWYEYWPIRNFLITQPLMENAFYGFLSPKFQVKTNLTSGAVHAFVAQQAAADVVLLSPSLHLTAYHLNVFKFGEAMHPGLLDIAERFFRQIGHPTDLSDLVTTSRNEVHANYMIGKPRFWRAWLQITEALYAIAEDPADPLGAELRRPTHYRGDYNVPMKIFIMERVTTWLLARPGATLAAAVRDPFLARSRIYKVPGAMACDALKMAHIDRPRAGYLDVFRLVSRFGRTLSWLIRVGAMLGYRPISACLSALSRYWPRAGEG